MYIRSKACLSTARQSGISLIELIIFIVIVSIGLVGILSVMNVTTKASSDPLITKQAISIAESLMEEIQLQPFTFCDPDDPLMPTASSPAGCTPGFTQSGETRFGPVPFDNVGDYNNSSPSGNIIGATVAGYSTTVSISDAGQSAFGLPAAANSDALKIVVQVTGPSSTVVSLTGYRLRYAPNSGP